MSMVDPERVAALIRSVAQQAILPRFRNLRPADIVEKGPNDLVTAADIESEKLLTAGLTELLPGSVVVGEEATYADPRVMDRLAGEAPVWILDPVDGTLNFAKGDEGFAVIVALAHRGRTVQGWILDPVGDHIAVAEAGRGAWLDGARLHVNNDRPIGDMTGVVWGGSAAIKAIKPRVREVVIRGSAGRAYMALAGGQLDFLHARKLFPWDHAAGALMMREAGGVAMLFDGTDYRPTPLTGRMLVAPGPASWRELRDLVAE
jgi:fructose-1,6-bisphosphatase/inositol monophosphatase family enzyme